MQILLGKTAKEKRAALTRLYETYWRDAKVLCSGLLLDEKGAENAVVWAFGHVWGEVLDGQVKTEEAFRQHLLGKAALYCRRKCLKAGQSSLPVPTQKNFFIASGKGPATGQNLWEAMQQSLPLAGRFVFVLYRAADFDKKWIAEMTGLKHSVVEMALDAEEQNLAHVYGAIGGGAAADAGARLEREIKDAAAGAQLSEPAQKQILDSIGALMAPLEKEAQKKRRIQAGIAAAAVFVAILFAVVGKMWLATGGQAEGTVQEPESAGASEIIATHYADIVIEDYGTITVALDGNTAPKTVENFVSLAEAGFYDGLTFHRIMEGFMMQGGDPNGDGTGGAENNIVGEFSANGYENPLSHTRGAISMARSDDPDSASSQFFIVHEDSPSLDGKYAVFGYVTEGMDVVDQVCTSAKPIDGDGTIPSAEQPVITSITVRGV